MDFDFTAREQEFRREVRAWLDANVPDDLRGRNFARSRADLGLVSRLRAWHRMLHEAGYVGMDWPPRFGGRGASLTEQMILYEEMARAQAPQPIGRAGLGMLGPTLMAHGTEAQQRRYLPKILTAEEVWCQGFSEPNAGSDLASLQTRAVRDGDALVVRGQKIWTSLGHFAEWGFFLVRTDPDAPRHKGLSFLLIDMKSPGLTVRPLLQMTGEAEFNEVFLDDVRVPLDRVVGEVNRGWDVAMTMLGYERDLVTFVRNISLRHALDKLLGLVRRLGRGDDPVLRQKIARVLIHEQCLRLNGYRSLGRILAGRRPGPEGSTAKLFWSRVDQELAELATEVLGPYSQLAEGSSHAPDDGQWALYSVVSRASTIRGGTSEILNNILGERVLGLPKD